MIKRIKRRIQHSRARCRKAAQAHRQKALREGTKQEIRKECGKS
ncbi:MAG: hypothetical protein WCB68_12945 [Pyrinomonadaceae bacterium]